ncbi:MAG: nitrous oxide reductase family maturation protein NosD [Deltaproteobacteria bacterium]|nr:nitrous oxide reductase family maturation protein NosD [Deltaproteobacteria bacterium]MBW2444694.1 nitrous oxide reductase family maturation protein NosD [Deltaproteobacteria bacterium]
MRARLHGTCWAAVLIAALLFAGGSRASVIRVGRDAPSPAAAVAAAREGDVVELPPGSWPGPLRIDKALTLRGVGGVLDGGGVGTVLTIDAPGVRVEGLHLANSGEDIGAPDACIFITQRSTGAEVRDSTMRRCAFGVWVHETRGVRILDNQIEGNSGLRVADRGNGIHLFDASELVVRGNRISGARDGIYVSATEDSLIEDNRTDGQRFGIHYMYSYRNTLRGNRSHDNVVGMALMESRHLVVEDNEALRNERNGILFRDVQFSRIHGNRLEGNGNGMFFFSSTENSIRDNRIADNDVGLKIWAGTRRNVVENNHIVGNRQQVFYVGAKDQTWGEAGRGNRWGDYVGWDQDGDGVGDRPYRVDSFKARLNYQYPATVLLLHSPALEILSHLSNHLPLLQTPTVVDVSPLLGEASP